MENNKKHKGNIFRTVFYITASFVLGAFFMYFVVSQNSDKIIENSKVVSKTLNETSDLKEAINNVYNATVYIEVTSQRNTMMGVSNITSSGSGFVYKKDDNYGYIITNYHVVDGASDIVVTYNDGTEVSAKIAGSDEYSDIAVLLVDSSSVLQVAEIGTSSNVEIGDTLFTVGAPLGKDYMGTITQGILSGKNRMVEVEISSGSFLMETLQTDASINSGNSGGPLCNILGQVIGVNSSKLVGEGIEGMGFAIPIDSVMTIIDDLESGKEISRPYLGIQMTDISTLYNSQYRYNITIGGDIKYGVVLTYVEEGKPASNAGLQVGDVIVEMDGEKVEDTSYFRYLLYKHNINESIKVKYYRDNELKESTINLTEKIES